MNCTRVFITALVGAAVLGAPTASAGDNDVAAARSATARYHRVAVAEADGYGRFLDANGIACIDNPPLGAMGIHYVNGGLVGDAVLDATRPEALVYEPTPNGRLRLVALEYIVFKDVWEAAGHLRPPSLFGHEFGFVNSPNRYGIPPFYELHAWVWKHNPSGMFFEWNPAVSCAAA